MKKFPTNFGFGGIGMNDVGSAYIKALSAPSVVVADGAGANTDITVAGLTAASVVVSVLAINAGVPSVATVASVAAGKLKLNEATTGAKVVVTFLP
jgi:hypothetical protein